MAGRIVSVPTHLITDALLAAGLQRPFADEEGPEKQEEDPARARERQRAIDFACKLWAEHRRANRDPVARAAAKEEMRRKTLEMQRRCGGRRWSSMELQAQRHILDFDPKQGGMYHARLYYVGDLMTFDHDEESPLGPMRFTDAVYKDKADCVLCDAVNIFSLKIASLDVAFPIHVYGTVIARDSIDKKCVYLFRRDRYNCQLISSEDESLILTGPKRGLALISATYVETDLKIKGFEGQEDRELSKGVLRIKGMERRVLKKCDLESCSLATRLSTVDMMHSVVKRAVEATFAFEVLQGDFYGEIYACTSTIRNGLVLHDSELTSEAAGCYGRKCADVMAGHGTRTIQLMQPVVSVSVNELLVVAISTKVPHGRDNHGCKRYLCFVPSVNGCTEREVTIGRTKISMKIVWSRIDN